MLDPVPGRRRQGLLRLPLGLGGLQAIPLLRLGRDDVLELLVVLVEVIFFALLEVLIVGLLIVGLLIVGLLSLEVLVIQLLIDPAVVLGEVVAELVLLSLVGAGLLVTLVLSPAILVGAHSVAIPGKVFTKPSSACR